MITFYKVSLFRYSRTFPEHKYRRVLLGIGLEQQTIIIRNSSFILFVPLTKTMLKGILASVLFFIVTHAEAQLGVMKMVGPNTGNYSLGFGAYVKGIFPVSQAADVTLELGANLFFLNDGAEDGTAVIPIKAGYRYSLNGTGLGLYVEPQIGYNIYGVTSAANIDGTTANLTFHGVVFAAGTGYLFLVGNTPLDLNFHYETIMAHGGSDNYVSLGLTFYLRFGKRPTDY